MGTFIGGVYATDAGMVCLWNPVAFAGVVDYDTWEPELCEDKEILRTSGMRRRPDLITKAA